MNKEFIYDQNSVRVRIVGLPDISLGQEEGTIGILSSWKLTIAGFPQLEGKLEHLQNLMSIIYPYTTYFISGFKRTFGDANSSIIIDPVTNGHKIRLISSKEGIKPLTIVIDDAELSDLVFCLDSIRSDDNVKLSWQIPQLKPIPRNFKETKNEFIKGLLPSLLGASTLMIFAIVTVLLPNQIIIDDVIRIPIKERQE